MEKVLKNHLSCVIIIFEGHENMVFFFYFSCCQINFSKFKLFLNRFAYFQKQRRSWIYIWFKRFPFKCKNTNSKQVSYISQLNNIIILLQREPNQQISDASQCKNFEPFSVASQCKTFNQFQLHQIGIQISNFLLH